jgi:hypothetical protein
MQVWCNGSTGLLHGLSRGSTPLTCTNLASEIASKPLRQRQGSKPVGELGEDALHMALLPEGIDVLDCSRNRLIV